MNQDTFGIISGIVQTVAGIAAAVFALVSYLHPEQHTIPRWASLVILAVGLSFLLFAVNPLRRAWKPVRRVRIYVEQIDAAAAAKITFKPKVRMVFRNDSDRCIDVETGGWQERTDGIPLRPSQPNSTWQTYNGKVWTPSPTGESQLHVRPGVLFRIWLVFGANLSEADLQRRITEKHLGTLELRVGKRVLKFKA
jgi:hypothetical protein